LLHDDSPTQFVWNDLENDSLLDVRGKEGLFSVPQGFLCLRFKFAIHPKVQEWLERHPRLHIDFVPTGSSWMNMVERYFRDITENHIRRGVFRSVDELECTILEAIDKYNDAPRPYIWTAKANDILAKVIRARAAQNGPRISGNLH